MFDFLSPGKIGDIDQTVNSFFQFNKNTKVCKVSNGTYMLGTNRVFRFDIFPRICVKLLDTKRYLSVASVQCKNFCFNLVTNFYEITGASQVSRDRKITRLNSSHV